MEVREMVNDTLLGRDLGIPYDGGGIRAVDKKGHDLGAHQAFWFAWSQFHPDTVIWPM